MSKAAHTPGEWRDDDTGAIYVIIGERRELLADAYPMDADRSFKNLQQRANARLIAAAPELLAALQGVVEFWDAITMEDSVNTLHVQAREAIAKATGSAE